MARRSASAAPAAPARRYRVLLVAGEASGDLHGADLLAALRARLPDVEVFGIGGGGLRGGGGGTGGGAGGGAAAGVAGGGGGRRGLVRAPLAPRRARAPQPPA